MSTETTYFHLPTKATGTNRRKLLAACIVCCCALVVLVVVGAALAGRASASNLALKNQAPSWEHPFGCDWLGRDMLARTLAGLATSVGLGLVAASVSAVVALVLGIAAALGTRRLDACITWLIDVVMSVPHIVLLILVSYALGRGFWGVAVGVALTHWPSLTRVIRAEVLQVRNSRYVRIARQLGVGATRIARTHIVPAVFPQFIVGLVLLFPHAILHEASITFLGFGLGAEVPAIGIILSESMHYLSAGMWWLAFFPGCALVATVMLFFTAGQCLRRLIDPHQSQM